MFPGRFELTTLVRQQPLFTMRFRCRQRIRVFDGRQVGLDNIIARSRRLTQQRRRLGTVAQRSTSQRDEC